MTDNTPDIPDQAPLLPLAVDATVAGPMIGVSALTMKGWRAAGTGPPWVQLDGGPRVRYLVADLEAWLRENRVVPGAKAPAPQRE